MESKIHAISESHFWLIVSAFFLKIYWKAAPSANIFPFFSWSLHTIWWQNSLLRTSEMPTEEGTVPGQRGEQERGSASEGQQEQRKKGRRSETEVIGNPQIKGLTAEN